jgi:choline dehydrogenase-like flavoprotein
MGMTRMSNNDQDGVVDNKCKVFDTDNLYILSTSVFPSYSHAQPTFTLAALIFYFLDVNDITKND